MSFEAESSFAIDLAHKAGAAIKQHIQADKAFTIKADRSPVTDLDKQINELVARSIGERFPADRFIGEEGRAGKTDASRVWLCDPIDGTDAFLLGVPEVNFMLALYVDGVAQMAVTYNPMTERLYHAMRGHGAFCNDKRISVVDTVTSAHPYVLCDPKILRESPKLAQRVEAAGFQVAFRDSSCENLMLVASGKAAAMIRATGAPEDIGVGALMVEEAGGKATALDGSKLLNDKFELPNGYIIGAPKAYQTLLKLVVEQ